MAAKTNSDKFRHKIGVAVADTFSQHKPKNNLVHKKL